MEAQIEFKTLLRKMEAQIELETILGQDRVPNTVIPLLRQDGGLNRVKDSHEATWRPK